MAGIEDSQDPQVSQLQQQVKQLAAQNQNLYWEQLENSYARENPNASFVFKDRELHEKARNEAVKYMQSEMQQHGRVVSTPQQILERGVNKAVAFSNRLKMEGARSEMEKRRKIDTSGADLGGREKPTKSPTADEEDKPLSRSDYVSMQQKSFDRAKTLI